MTAARELRVLLDDLMLVESPRWHDQRLWFADWGTGEILAVDLDGTSEVMGTGPSGPGWSIDWLMDGRLVVTGPRLSRQAPGGGLVEHADLSTMSDGWNEVVVDGRGNVYVNGGCDFDVRPGAPPGVIALVRPDGTTQQVASALAFPNGMAVTPDNSTLIVAESFANRLTAFDIGLDGDLANRRAWAEVDGFPDGVCMDADGAVWFADVPNRRCVRVREGGEVLDVVAVDRGCFACMLGGPDRRTLFVLAAEWAGPEDMEAQAGRRTARILTTDVDVPGVGWP